MGAESRGWRWEWCLRLAMGLLHHFVEYRTRATLAVLPTREPPGNTEEFSSNVD